MNRPNILSTILYCGENPIPQREPLNEDDEKAFSGLLYDEHGNSKFGTPLYFEHISENSEVS